MSDISQSRRLFLKALLTSTGGLVVGFPAARILGLDSKTNDTNIALGAFVEIGTDGSVTIVAPVPEVGQGVHTALPMLVAEELGADWPQVRVRQAPTGSEYGSMGVGGSDSIRDYWQPLRKAGAAARDMLIAAAAAAWAVSPDSCRTENGYVVHPASGRRLSFSALLPTAREMHVPQQPKLKDVRDYALIGHATPNVHVADIVTGKAQYGMDIRLPGMLFAVIERCPVYGGTLKSFSKAEALAVPGVVNVTEIEPLMIRDFSYGEVLGGVAVIAENTWAAMQGREALKVVWEDGPHRNESSSAISSRFKDALDTGLSHVIRNEGSLDHIDIDEELVLEYDLPALSQSPLEPMNFTADVRPESCEAWGPVQVPRNLQALLAIWLELPVDSVTINTTLVGGGFGRRLAVDYGIEATVLSRITGRPIQVLWTREDDMQHGFYRTPSRHRVAIGFDKKQRPVRWRHQIVTHPIAGTTSEHPGIYEVQGAADLPYDFEQITVQYAPVQTGIRPGSWRSVSHSFNSFVTNCAIDEIAAYTKNDPYELHQKLLGEPREKTIILPLPGRRGKVVCDVARLKRVLKLCAERADWHRPTPNGRGKGIACCYYKTTYAAHVAEVTVTDDGNIRVTRVVAVLDCGLVVNPDGVRAQIEGAVMDGIATVFDLEVTMQDGQIQQTNFDTYPFARLADTPELNIYLVSGHGSPGGAGEPPYPSVAPAIVNAIYDATGERIRKLPFRRT